MPYIDQATLNLNVTEAEPASDQAVLENVKNSGLIAVDEYLVMYNEGVYTIDEDGTNNVSYTASLGTLTAASTGLPYDFDYTEYRQGWIKIKDTTDSFIDIEVIQYSGYDSSLSYVSSILKILTIEQAAVDKEVLYNFINSMAFNQLNTSVVTINGVDRGETDVLVTPINIGTDGDNITGQLVVSSSDISNSVSGNILITLRIKDTDAAGLTLFTSTDSSSTPATLNVSKNLLNSEIPNTRIYVEFEITDVFA